MFTSNNSTKPALFQFYLLVFYVLLQFCWWAYLINNLNLEVHDLKIKIAEYTHKDELQLQLAHLKLNNKLHKRWLMITGEGTVFIFILSLGIYQTRKSFKREFEVARQQKNFLLAVTHELKSPIASARLQIETLLKRKPDEEKQHQMLMNALEDTERLDSLVEKVLLANRLDNSSFVLEKEKINLSLLYNNIVNNLSKSTLKNNVVKIDINNNIMINGDKLALTSILTNLLDNAAKYSPKESIIQLYLHNKNNTVSLKIIDEGIGIKSEEYDNIFKMFYRIGNEETRSAKGTGLGLYIVSNLVKQHKGTISVSNNKPKGSIFTIEFNA